MEAVLERRFPLAPTLPVRQGLDHRHLLAQTSLTAETMALRLPKAVEPMRLASVDLLRLAAAHPSSLLVPASMENRMAAARQAAL